MTANTVVIRPNQSAEVGDIKLDADTRVRRALTMAADNSVLLELGFFRQWTDAKNRQSPAIRPEYAELPPPVFDPDGAKALMDEAGMCDFKHDFDLDRQQLPPR